MWGWAPVLISAWNRFISMVIPSATLASLSRESKILSDYLMRGKDCTPLITAFLYSRITVIESLFCSRCSSRCWEHIFEQNKVPILIKFTLRWRNADQQTNKRKQTKLAMLYVPGDDVIQSGKKHLSKDQKQTLHEAL